MASRRRKRPLMWLGLAAGLAGILGKLAADRYMQDNPELYMGAVLARLFDSAAHLAPQEQAALFFVYYGHYVALAGCVLAFIGLVRRR